MFIDVQMFPVPDESIISSLKVVFGAAINLKTVVVTEKTIRTRHESV